jgi:predicted acylesterase/phospholipase RssA
MVRTSALAKPINLAPQGGGSQGAITGAVLDRLREDRRLLIQGDQR